MKNNLFSYSKLVWLKAAPGEGGENVSERPTGFLKKIDVKEKGSGYEATFEADGARAVLEFNREKPQVLYKQLQESGINLHTPNAMRLLDRSGVQKLAELAIYTINPRIPNDLNDKNTFKAILKDGHLALKTLAAHNLPYMESWIDILRLYAKDVAPSIRREANRRISQLVLSGGEY